MPLESERVRLGLQQETDERLIKTAALKEYYTIVIAFLNSGVDIRDYSERMLYYSSKLVGDLPYYKAFDIFHPCYPKKTKCSSVDNFNKH